MAKPQLNKSRKSRIQERRQAANKQRRRTQIITSSLLVGALLFWGYSFASQPKATSVSEARLNSNPFQGPEDAEIVLTEWADFGCPACRDWHLGGAIPYILDYFDGEIKMEWRDFPIIMPPNSEKAAQAGQCAFDQGLFWEFHDITFERDSYSALSNKDIRVYAELSGLDMGKFDTCFDSKQHAATVQLDLTAARNFGFRGTPSFSVNGIPVVGPNRGTIISVIEDILYSQ